MLDGLDEPHPLGLAVHHRQQDHTEALLHLGVLVQLVEDDLGLGAALEFYHDAHAVATGLVADVAHVVDGLIVNHLGDASHQCCLVDLVGNFGNDDRFAALRHVFNTGFSAHGESSAPSLVGVLDSAAAVYVSAGGEVWTFYDFQHLFERGGWSVHQHDGRFNDFR